MTSLLLAVLLSTAATTPAQSGVVTGIVQLDGAQLPGTTVTLISYDGRKVEAHTNAEGFYQFVDVSPGAYDVHYDLDGLNSVKHSFTAYPGLNELPVESLTLEETETITVACSAASCAGTAPSTPWDFPTCDDYALDDSLEQALLAHDDSAAALLRKRYETSLSLWEKHRIAGMLLGRIRDDAMYWDELEPYARNAVRFASEDEGTTQAFQDYCASLGVDPDSYRSLSYEALQFVQRDPRSHDLLLRALDSTDISVAFSAIWGLGKQHDLEALSAIDKTLDRFKDDDPTIALGLAAFESEAADAIAMKYLDEINRDNYNEERTALANESLH